MTLGRLPFNLNHMFGLSLGHLLILTLVVLLFGAKRLPELGGALGRGLSAFKKGLEGKDKDDDPNKQIPPKDDPHA